MDLILMTRRIKNRRAFYQKFFLDFAQIPDIILPELGTIKMINDY